MKVKKEYAILSVVIIALGFYLFFRNTDRTTYTLPELPAIKSQDLTKVEIGKGDLTVVLTRRNDDWFVSPGDYPADVTLVNRMLDTLAGLKVTALVSETRNYARYELDEDKQLRVTAYQGDKALRALHIGKAAGTMRHTHITLSEDPNVYHAQGNFRQDFDQSVASLRDKSVLAFKKDEIKEFSIDAGDRYVVLQKTDAPQPSEDNTTASEDKPATAADAEWKTADGQTVANDAVQKLLSALSGLKCRAYLTDPSQTELTHPAYLIRIKGAQESTLEIFAPAEDTATELKARSSLRKDPFTLSDFDVDPVKNFLTDLNSTEDKPTP